MLKKKTFLARAFRTRAIDLWNNLDCAIKLISSTHKILFEVSK